MKRCQTESWINLCVCVCTHIPQYLCMFVCMYYVVCIHIYIKIWIKLYMCIYIIMNGYISEYAHTIFTSIICICMLYKKCLHLKYMCMCTYPNFFLSPAYLSFKFCWKVGYVLSLGYFSLSQWWVGYRGDSVTGIMTCLSLFFYPGHMWWYMCNGLVMSYPMNAHRQ